MIGINKLGIKKLYMSVIMLHVNELITDLIKNRYISAKNTCFIRVENKAWVEKY